jgi:RNA polymerase sigma-70 factor (ECF subfamily)
VPDSFEQTLVDATRNHLRRYARKLTHDRDAADDLVQDVALLCLAKRHLFKPGTNQIVWMMVVMHNKHASNCLYAARRATIPLDGVIVTSNSDPSSSQLILELKAGLRDLPLKLRSAVISTYKGIEYQQIADTKGISINTVRSRIHRGRARLRNYCDRPRV